jgi:hypothetical protein
MAPATRHQVSRSLDDYEHPIRVASPLVAVDDP